MRQKNLYLTRERHSLPDEPNVILQRQNYFSKDEKVKNICIFHWLQYDSDRHDHDYIELAYVISGKLYHYLDGERTSLGRGDFVFLNYGDLHQYKLQSGKTAYLINCAFLPSFLNQTKTDCRDFNEVLASAPFFYTKGTLNKNPCRHVFKDSKDKRVRNLLEDMIKEYNTPYSGNDEIIRSHLKEIIIRAMRQISGDIEESRDSFAVKALRYASENMTVADLSINRLAESEGISRQHASKKFKDATGKSFGEHLRFLRINHCCDAILKSDRQISEIAEEAGYRDMNTFYKHFKAETGMTPGEYKKGVKF